MTEENGGRCRKTSNINLKALICKYAYVHAKHITKYKKMQYSQLGKYEIVLFAVWFILEIRKPIAFWFDWILR